MKNVFVVNVLSDLQLIFGFDGETASTHNLKVFFKQNKNKT